MVDGDRLVGADQGPVVAQRQPHRVVFGQRQLRNLGSRHSVPADGRREKKREQGRKMLH